MCKDFDDWKEHFYQILEGSNQHCSSYPEPSTVEEIHIQNSLWAWYGYKPNVSYFKVFGSKCYILKESRKGKFDIKGDEGIFFGYSCKSKTYRCLNLSTHKVIESAHVKVDEFAKETTKESKKEPEDYRRFIFIDTIPETSIDKRTIPAETIFATELEIVHTKLQKLESLTIAIKLELPKREVELQEDNSAKNSKGKELVLAKYVRRHHTPD